MLATPARNSHHLAALLIVALCAASGRADPGCVRVSDFYPAPVPSLGVATLGFPALGTVNIAEAILPSGAPAGMAIRDCDGDGGMDLEIGWSLTATSPAEIDMSFACGGGRLPDVVRVTIITDNAVLQATDATGAIVATAPAAPVYMSQELVVAHSNGIAHVLIEGTQMCLTEVCWQCPTVAAASFHRGDSNNDGGVDLSDAVNTLLFLFNAGSEPACLDAADSNDDGTVDISDPTSTLNFLFLGGPPPSGGLGCAPDGSQDALACREAACSA